MRCCVPYCETDAQNVSESAGITFHEFPSEEHHRAAWLRALGIQDRPLPDSVVCSRHFLNDDICVTECGSRQIRTDAIPSTVQVCMICLDTQSKLFLMSKYKLEGTYEHLLGIPLYDKRNLKQTLCIQCAQRLVNFSKFRDKSLKVHSLMMELVERHEFITIPHIKSICQVKSDIVKTVLEPDHYDVCITHSDTHTDMEPDTTIESVAVKSEEKDDSMSVDEDRTEQHTVVTIEDNNFTDSFNEHSVAFKEEYLSDDNSPSEAMKNRLLITPSTSKQFPELETTVQIKNEITIACTTCLEEFTEENMYLQHTLKHLEDDQNLDEYIISDYPHTSAAGVAPSLEIKRRRTVDPSEGADEVDTIAPVHPTDSRDELDISAFENNKTLVEDLRRARNIELKPNESLTDSSGSINLRRKRKYIKTRQSDTHSSRMKGSNSRERTSGTRLGECSEQEYICDVCQETFQQKRLLVTHIRAHTNAKTVCRYKRKGSSALDRHTHTGEKPFASELCEYKCAQKSNLVRHMKIHTGEKPFSCKLCDYKCAQKSYLVHHMKTHTGEKPFVCKLCDYKCAIKCNLVHHMKTHTGEKPFVCKLCDYKSKYNFHLVQHMKTHTGEKPFVCKLCNYKCTRKDNLVNHMRTHTGEKPFACKLCDYKSGDKRNLVQHTKTHTGEKPFVCKLCNYKCTRKDNLVNHMRTHTGEKPFACELCDYKCTGNSSLVRHMKIHTGEKPFVCKLCDYKCAFKCNLVQHMKTHTEEKPFACELCDYKCAQKSTLVRHMKIHTGEKPFSCKLCDHEYAHKSNLVYHMKTHTGEKPFACELCDYKCTRKSYLVHHMKTHTGEKPFVCKLCDYKCAFKCNLVQHMKTHRRKTICL